MYERMLVPLFLLHFFDSVKLKEDGLGINQTKT